MKHLYTMDEEGEVYAADSEDQARDYYRELTGTEPSFIRQEYDGVVVLDRGMHPDADLEVIGKTYAEVADMYSDPCQVWTAYI